jgi:putative flippase GtrA
VTFKDGGSRRRKRQQPWLTRWGKFQLACLAGNVIIIAIQLGLLATASLSPAIGHVLGSLVTYPITYLISSRFVWAMGPVS